MGFYPKKYLSLTALLSVLHDWHQFLAKGIEVCAVFFDLCKAFDTVLLYPLLCKLDNLGIDHYLLKWICNYQSDRKQQMVVDGAISAELYLLCLEYPKALCLVHCCFWFTLMGLRWLLSQMELSSCMPMILTNILTGRSLVIGTGH